MGRRKIPIELIADERNRQATFAKRKAGLLKKAMELSVLCGADVAVVVFDSRGQRYEGGFLGSAAGAKAGGADAVLARRAAAHTAAAQTTGTAELLRKYHGDKAGRAPARRAAAAPYDDGVASSPEDDDEDDDDDEEDSESRPPRKRRSTAGRSAALPARAGLRRRSRPAVDAGGDAGGAESVLVALPPPPRAPPLPPAARRPPPLLLPADAGAPWGVTAVPAGADLSPLLRGLPSGSPPRNAAAAFAAIASCRASGGVAAAASAAFAGSAPASVAAAQHAPGLAAVTPFSAALAAMRWPSPAAAPGQTMLSARQPSLGALLAGIAGHTPHGTAAFFDVQPASIMGGVNAAMAEYARGAMAQHHGHHGAGATTPGSASAERAKASA